MKILMVLLFTIFLAACSQPKYEKEDVVAILDGEEITAEEVLWQYPLNDEQSEEHIKNYLKEEILVKEAIERGITVSEQEIEESKQAMAPEADVEMRYEIHSEENDFYDNQADTLDVSPITFYEIWEDRIYTNQLYIDEYINELFGEPEDDKGEQWGRNIDNHVDDLYDEYLEEGRLILKIE
ncbi:hypothetical protein [Halalkalibacillus halophilus]|uniref:hypothetical protein n=1 Tax=Halalkalibacillus halophilus TaxID=392827 RepID=UPI00040E1880|nr:hypothetical protein [Halalkalibacillus halophilus]